MLGRLGAVVVVLAGCTRTPADDAAPPAPQPHVVPTVPTTTPAVAPRVPQAPPATARPEWRQRLDEVQTLQQLQAYEFQLPDGPKAVDARVAAAQRAYEAAVVALPDGSPDLPAAACALEDAPRGVRETQLRRAIAVATAPAHGDVAALDGWLRRERLAIEPALAVRGDALVDDASVEMYSLRGRCDTPDAGHLRVVLADLYGEEARYPKDPFTGEAYPGPPTSKRGQHEPGVAELTALYDEVTTAHDELAAVALLEMASVGFCERGPTGGVCQSREAVLERALDVRARLLPADDPLLADTRIEHARLRVATRQVPATVRAAGELREVLGSAPAGSPDRLLAALELYPLVRDINAAEARALEPGLRADLALAVGNAGLTLTTVATAWAFLAHGEHRDGDATAILAAAAVGAAHPDPRCTAMPSCDPRYALLAVLTEQAKYDHDNADTLRRRVAALQLDIDASQQQGVDALRRLLAAAPP
jgi:hypothetical protein